MVEAYSEEWHKEVSENHARRDVEGLKRWGDIITSIFPKGPVHGTTWIQIDQITDILDEIGRISNSNHTFCPRGGGFDLIGSGLAGEKNCIELLSDGTATIVKPKKLIFNAFGTDPQWYYFHLETNHIQPSGIYDEPVGEYEELCELSPGEYEERYVWDQGFYGHDERGYELSLPEEARPVNREFDGSFVIFGKYSEYNKDTSTYDGRHNHGTSQDFAQYILKNTNAIK